MKQGCFDKLCFIESIHKKGLNIETTGENHMILM